MSPGCTDTPCIKTHTYTNQFWNYLNKAAGRLFRGGEEWVGAYPDKHVQLLLTPFLQFFYLSLARVADIQVVDSRSPSVPAGNSTYKLTRYFSQRNRWIWRCLKPPASLKAAVSTSCTCCKGDPTRSAAASLPGHRWMSLCWAAHLMKRSETAVRRLQCNILFYMKCNSSHGYRSVLSLNRARSSTMHNSVKFTAQTVLPISLNILQFLLFSDPQSLLLKLLPKLHV